MTREEYINNVLKEYDYSCRCYSICIAGRQYSDAQAYAERAQVAWTDAMHAALNSPIKH